MNKEVKGNFVVTIPFNVKLYQPYFLNITANVIIVQGPLTPFNSDKR